MPRNRWLRILVAVMVAALVGTSPAGAQGVDFDDQVEALEALFAAGRYAETEAEADRLLELGEQRFGLDSPKLIPVLDTYGGVHWLRGDVDALVSALIRIVAIAELHPGPDDTVLERYLYQGAGTLAGAGHYAESRIFIEKLENHLTGKYGPGNVLLAEALDLRGELAIAEKDLARAESAFQEALGIRTETLAPGHRSILETMAKLAEVAWERGRREEAVDRLRQLDDHYETIKRRSLEAQYDARFTRLRLANYLMNMGREEEAETTFLKIIQAGPIDDESLALGRIDITLVVALRRVADRRVERDVRAGNDIIFRRARPFLELPLSAAREPQHRKFFAVQWKEVARMLTSVGKLHAKMERTAENNPYYALALTLWEGFLETVDKRSVGDVHRLGQALYYAGAKEESERTLKRALESAEALTDPEPKLLARIYMTLGYLYADWPRLADAEAVFRKALEIREGLAEAGRLTSSGDRLALAHSLERLGGILVRQERHGEAEPNVRRLIDMRERELPAFHPDVTSAHYGLALIHTKLGRYREAERIVFRLLDVIHRIPTERREGVMDMAFWLAGKLMHEGRYAESETIYKRLVPAAEETVGELHDFTGTILFNLGSVYMLQNRNIEAQAVFERCLALRERARGPDDKELVIVLRHLAMIADMEEGFVAAVRWLERAVAIADKAPNMEAKEHRNLLSRLANLYGEIDRDAERQRLLDRRDALEEVAQSEEEREDQRFWRRHDALLEAGDLVAVEGMRRDRLERKVAEVGPYHRDVVEPLEFVAEILFRQGRHREAVETNRKAVAIRRRLLTQTSAHQSRGFRGSQFVRSATFVAHIEFISQVLGQNPDQDQDLVAESFEAGQIVNTTAAASAVTRMASRYAAGDKALAGAVRNKQDAYERWQVLDKMLAEAVALPPEQRDSDDIEKLKAGLLETEAALRRLEARLDRDFPDYRDLASAKPLGLAETRNLLAPDEALIMYLPWEWRADYVENVTFLWVVRRQRAWLYRLPINRTDLEALVVGLRSGMDSTHIRDIAELFEFEAGDAHRLYASIFRPAEPALAGARHLFVVAGGALQSLPFGVLLTEPAAERFSSFRQFREAPWLARRFAMSVLPSVASLRAIRKVAKLSSAGQAFLGVGDPLLADHPGPMRGIAADMKSWLSQRRRSIDVNQAYRGFGRVGMAELRAIPSLPETAVELNAIADSFGAEASALVLRENATEPTLRGTLKLKDFRVLAFATHGLVAGDLKGLAEPALLLTPPETATEGDDGLLTASEIAEMDLDADWVILSACNTAAADGTPGAEALSGLARSFFFADSRALLVSHWPVASEATVKLTTRMFDLMRRNPDLRRAEAHRLAMLSLVDDTDTEYLAHPLFWAPFVVIGEGGAPSSDASAN